MRRPLALIAPLSSFAAAAFLPVAASANTTLPSYLDLFYAAASEIEIGDADFDDGDGYGAKGRFVLPGGLFFAGEYQNLEYDPFDVDNGGLLGGSTRFEIELESWRAGLGYHLAETPFYLLGEYIGYESEFSTTGAEADEETLGDDIDESGYGVHAGINGRLTDFLALNGQIGYVDVGDAGDGMEYLVGASLGFGSSLGLFADYRFTDLEEDVDTEISGFRVGLRLAFN